MLKGKAPLLIAVILAALAAVMVHSVMSKKEAEVRKGWNLTPIVVAAMDIEEGQTITMDMMSRHMIPEQFVTSSVIKPESANYVDGQKVLVPIQKVNGGMPARDILNGILMKAMDEVGRRFDRGELIVPEVLTCAEVLKAAIGILEPNLAASGDGTAACRGKLLLATVKGDVHDIGKNLVSMIFSSNGFEVEDLGVKVEDAAIVRAAQATKPDVIGLSGLLVRSALQMVETVRTLDAAGISVPVLVGGAALSQAFTDRHIAPATRSLVVYSRDAMSCLARAKAICAEGGEAKVRAEEAARRAASESEKSAKSAEPEAKSEEAIYDRGHSGPAPGFGADAERCGHRDSRRGPRAASGNGRGPGTFEAPP